MHRDVCVCSCVRACVFKSGCVFMVCVRAIYVYVRVNVVCVVYVCVYVIYARACVCVIEWEGPHA